MASDLLEKIYAQSDKIKAWPPEARERILNRLFDKAIGSKLPKAADEEQRGQIRERFKAKIMGVQLPPLQPNVRPEDYARQGLPTGAGGSFLSGVERGSGNLTGLLDKFNPINWALKAAGEKPLESLSPDMKQAGEIFEKSSAPYSEAHPKMSRLLQGVGSSLPGMPISTAMAESVPGLKFGGPLISGVLTGALRGAAGGVGDASSLDPTLKGALEYATIGAKGGAVLGGLGGLVGKMAGARAATKVASKAAPETGGEFEQIAQSKFQKPLAQLTSEQKMEVLTAAREKAIAVQDAAKNAKKAATASAKEAKVTAASPEGKLAKLQEATAKKGEIVLKMQQEKELQKQIARFVRTNKRVPTEDEIKVLRTAPVAPKAAPAAEPAGSPKPARQEMAESIKERMGEIENQIKDPNVAPQDKIIAAQLHQQMGAMHQELTKPLAEALKAESPQAVAAAQSVGEAVKHIKQISEGTSGLTGHQAVLMAKLDSALSEHASSQNPMAKAALKKTIANVKKALGGDESVLKKIKNAERKAASRASAAAEAPSSEGVKTAETLVDKAATPEEALAEKESMFLDKMDELESMGIDGKKAAKNMNLLVKSGKLTYDKALGMVDKVKAGLAKQSLGVK